MDKSNQNTEWKIKSENNCILRYYFYKVGKEPPPCKADQCIMYTHTHTHKPVHNFIKDKGEVKTKLRGDF